MHGAVGNPELTLRTETPEAQPARPQGRGLTGQSIPLAGSIAIFGLTMAGQNTTLSLFLVNAVHAAPFFVGLFFTARAASGMVAGLVTGWVSDRMRDRRVVIGVTSLAGAAGALCLALLRDYALLLVSGVVFASIGAGAFGQLFAYANEFATGRGRDVTFFTSVMRSLFSAAYIVGPPLGLFIMAKYGFRPLYLGITGLSLVSAAVGRWGLRHAPSKVSTRAAPGSRERGAVWRAVRSASMPARTWLLLGVVVVLTTVNQMFNIDISLHVTKDLGLSPQLVGWMLGLAAGLEIPVMIGAGRVAMRVGRGRLVGMSALLAVVSFCLLPVAATSVALLGIAALSGIWQGVALSIPMVMIQEEAPGGVGTSSALYGATFGAASMIAGAVTGVTASALGYGNVFWVCAGLSGVAAGGMLARFALGRSLKSPLRCGQPGA
jgi:SET family sugar efflux transporter-like MFS transporter